jgi:hypothetical protein
VQYISIVPSDDGRVGKTITPVHKNSLEFHISITQALQIPAPYGNLICNITSRFVESSGCLTARNQHHGGALWHTYELDIGV